MMARKPSWSVHITISITSGLFFSRMELWVTFHIENAKCNAIHWERTVVDAIVKERGDRNRRQRKSAPQEAKSTSFSSACLGNVLCEGSQTSGIHDANRYDCQETQAAHKIVTILSSLFAQRNLDSSPFSSLDAGPSHPALLQHPLCVAYSS